MTQKLCSYCKIVPAEDGEDYCQFCGESCRERDNRMERELNLADAVCPIFRLPEAIITGLIDGEYADEHLAEKNSTECDGGGQA